MRILQLCPRVPFPLTDGGRIGIYHLTKHLALRGDVIDMIAFAEDDTTDSHIAALEQYCTVRLIRDNIKTNIRNFIRGVFRNEPLYIARHQSALFHQAVREAMAQTTYDAVIGDHSAMFPYLTEVKRVSGIPTAVRLHNVESVIWHRYAHDLRNPVMRAIAAWQAGLLERYEARNATLVDVNFTITEVDRARMERLAPSAHIVTILPGVDPVQWPMVERNPRSTIAITATTFSWIHNVNGALWFLDHVMPLVQARIPAFEVHLLGKQPPAVLLRRASASVRVPGFVEDIRVDIAKAGVYIVPLHVGSGIRIKILEAMAMGIPVVTTSVGCEGIEGTPGLHFLVADTAEEFGDAIVSLLTRPEFAHMMSCATREFVIGKFNWDTSAEGIHHALEDIAAKRSGRAGNENSDTIAQ